MPPNSRRTPASASLRVRVRMYRQGLGDCFLISFFQKKLTHHVLIDCGVLLGTADAADKMKQVVQDILQETDGRLDLVVATHEHWDHLSGFVQAQELFDKITFSQVWMAWTEDPANPTAKALRSERSMLVNNLHVALGLMQTDTDNMQFMAYRDGIQGLVQFFGEPLAAKGARSTEEALKYVRSRAGRVKYCLPGQKPQQLDGLPGVRFFILGPPTNISLLKKSDPSKRDSETYELFSSLSIESGFFTALQLAAGDQVMTVSRSSSLPFDPRFQVSEEAAGQDPFFVSNYGFKDGPEHGLEWRRIAGSWLNMAGELALKLDNDTNNTSLVLAIELVESGQVLLFPADAQVGNWLSWEDLSWKVKNLEGEDETLTSADLLSRTALYKVGHHGSHNATLRQKGLELMESDRLVAMIPVESGMAQVKGWEMPFESLLERLKEKTRGRVIRLDEGLPKREELPWLTEAESRDFFSHTRQTDLFIECNFPF